MAHQLSNEHHIAGHFQHRGAERVSCRIRYQAFRKAAFFPFDITLAGTNEQGSATAMKIFGVEILNEGSGISIDDSVQEMQSTFVARFIEPWQAVQSKFRGNLGGGKL